MLTMFDSVEPKAFPVSGFDATAGYVVGSNYPSSAGIITRFPYLPHVTIATSASLNARCLDVEQRNATNEQAPAWLDRQYMLGQRLPILYTSASNVSALLAAVGPKRRFLLWSAHWAGPHICGPESCGYPQADATQWKNGGPNGEVVDQSLLTDRFFQAIGGDVPATLTPLDLDTLAAGVAARLPKYSLTPQA